MYHMMMHGTSSYAPCVSSSPKLTTKVQYIEGLVWAQNHQIWSKHNSSCFLLIIVDLLTIAAISLAFILKTAVPERLYFQDNGM